MSEIELHISFVLKRKIPAFISLKVRKALFEADGDSLLCSRTIYLDRFPQICRLYICFFSLQFNRCITSQLIKWFSNFREFYYIQMEKFARHAVAAVADVRSLTVGRESELFRALNVHYNKANDFQVKRVGHFFKVLLGLMSRSHHAV